MKKGTRAHECPGAFECAPALAAAGMRLTREQAMVLATAAQLRPLPAPEVRYTSRPAAIRALIFQFLDAGGDDGGHSGGASPSDPPCVALLSYASGSCSCLTTTKT